MKYGFTKLLFIATLSLLLIKYTNPSCINVGTTLFSESDVYKQCWSSENIAILTTRMVLEDLLPATSVLTIQDNEFVNDIIQYFRLILEVIRKETFGKTKHITLIALTDLLGGYLHHAVLPIAKHSYYAGLIDYVSMEKLIQLFDELKWFLRTNGQGWAPPFPQDPFGLSVQRIPCQKPTPTMQPCNGLVIYDHTKQLQLPANQHCPGNATPTGTGPSVLVPLPFFDAKHKPVAIAVPFKAYPLRNVESKCSAYVIMKYYIAGYKCLMSKNANKEAIKTFQNNLYTWINKEVLPKMNDDKFYSAFGGVLRVSATLKHAGATEVDLTKAIHSMNQLGAGGNKNTTEEYEEVGNVGAVTGQSSGERLSKKSMLLMALLIVIGIWFLIGTVFICYRMRSTKGAGGRSQSSRSGSTKPSSDASKSKGKGQGTPQKKGQSSGAGSASGPDDGTDGSPQVQSYACHSSLTGDYANEDNRRRGQYVFPYDDFETSESETTSRVSEGETEGKSELSK